MGKCIMDETILCQHSERCNSVCEWYLARKMKPLGVNLPENILIDAKR